MNERVIQLCNELQARINYHLEQISECDLPDGTVENLQGILNAANRIKDTLSDGPETDDETSSDLMKKDLEDCSISTAETGVVNAIKSQKRKQFPIPKKTYRYLWDADD